MELVSQDFTPPFGELILGAYKSELVLCDWKYRKMRSAIDKRINEGLEMVEGDSRFHGNDIEKRNTEIIEKTNSANFSL
jgi:methylated-DNA-[protein]-cysteine S-methyltransferase